MQASVSIVNNSSEAVRAVTVNIRSVDIPTSKITRKCGSLLFVSDKEERASKSSLRLKVIKHAFQIYWNSSVAVVITLFAIHTDSILEFGIIITTDNDFGRERFIDIASVVPAAVFVNVHLTFFTIFDNDRIGALPNLVIRQEHIEILDVRRFTLN